MAFRILKQTETLAVVKVWGTNSTDTITLNTDLLASTMVVDGTPRVNISFLTCYTEPADTAKITITRNAVPVLILYGLDQVDFSGNYGISEDTENASNFVVSIVGSGGVYLNLRKVAGYASKIETAQYSVYDDTNVVGS